MPRHIFLHFIDSLKSLPFQRWFSFWEKPEITGHQILAVGQLSHLSDLMFHQNICTRHEASSFITTMCPLLNHLKSFHGGMPKLNAKFDADSLLYSQSHFECDSHIVHMLTQRCLPPPLTSTVKSSLFTYTHSSPLSLAARLHQYGANHSRYINNGWTFSRQTSYAVDQNRLLLHLER